MAMQVQVASIPSIPPSRLLGCGKVHVVAVGVAVFVSRYVAQIKAGGMDVAKMVQQQLPRLQL